MGDENQPRGTFLIRPSEHNPNGYSLSVKDWEAHRGYHVKHYKIKPLDNGGFYISTNKTYDSLPELVMAYSSKLNHYKTFCIFNFFLVQKTLTDCAMFCPNPAGSRNPPCGTWPPPTEINGKFPGTKSSCCEGRLFFSIF